MEPADMVRLTLTDDSRPLYVRRDAILSFVRNQDDTATLVATTMREFAVIETTAEIFGMILAA